MINPFTIFFFQIRFKSPKDFLKHAFTHTVLQVWCFPYVMQITSVLQHFYVKPAVWCTKLQKMKTCGGYAYMVKNVEQPINFQNSMQAHKILGYCVKLFHKAHIQVRKSYIHLLSKNNHTMQTTKIFHKVLIQCEIPSVNEDNP